MRRKSLMRKLLPVFILAECAEAACLWVSPPGLVGIPRFLNSKVAEMRIVTGAKTVQLEVRE